MSDNANNITSALINTQVPEFVRNEHETFVQFLEYYYKFLEQDGQQTYVTKNFINFLDVDQITEDIRKDALKGDEHLLREGGDYHAFLQKMYDNFIKYIPDTVLADRTLILKHAREFYSTRGSEKSIRFLMRALYNKEVTFYYPKQDILRVSDGKWFIERSLKVKNVAVNNTANSMAVSLFANHLIEGLSSKATATVERVDVYFDKGQEVYELKISGIYREFENAESIFTYYTEEGEDKYLTAELFSGVITAVTINNGGSGYLEGSTIPITSSGTGAKVVISKVTKGIIQGVGVSYGGAGFRVSDPVVISGSGSGAEANVSNVNSNGAFHPNSYNVMWTTIALEASTNIGNAIYSNLVPSISDPANAWFSNSMSYFAYSNCGPAISCIVINTGNNYVPPLSLSISANSIISKLGILGRMEIIDGGMSYAANDKIEFLNPIGTTGFGAYANVANVDANGTITEIQFIEQPGQIIGGSGYDWNNLPKANVISGTGNGANIMVRAAIGHNDVLVASNSTIGTIQEITVISGGTGYIDNPVLRLDQLGDGTANAVLTVVTGAYSYPGRYINDDGHLSSYNFIEDRDYYQNFSYVVKVDETINKYRQPIKELIHPAGTKLFGEYLLTDDTQTNTNTSVVVTYSKTESNTRFLDTYYQVQGFDSVSYESIPVTGNAVGETISATFSRSLANISGTYQASNNTIVVYAPLHDLSNGDFVYLAFRTNAWANLVNANYKTTTVNTNYIIAINDKTESLIGNVGNVLVCDPRITVSIDQSLPKANDNVYMLFRTTDPNLPNGIYQVYSGQASNTFVVLHPMANNANDSSNTVSVVTKKVIITSDNHELETGNNIYVIYTTGDQANGVNTHYTVEAKTTNTINITSPNIILHGSNVTILTDKVRLYRDIAETFPFANGNTAYVTFASGDQANTVNGVYSAVKIDTNVLRIPVTVPPANGGNARLWYSTNNYSNILFTRTAHGFIPGDNVWIEFFTSSVDLANGVYRVNTAFGSSSNTYNIYYNANTYVNTTSNTVVYSGVGVTSTSKLEGGASVGLYK